MLAQSAAGSYSHNIIDKYILFACNKKLIVLLAEGLYCHELLGTVTSAGLLVIVVDINHAAALVCDMDVRRAGLLNFLCSRRH